MIGCGRWRRRRQSDKKVILVEGIKAEPTVQTLGLISIRQDFVSRNINHPLAECATPSFTLRIETTSMPVIQKIDDAISMKIAVEALLLDHLDVAEAMLTLEQGADGRVYPAAYVVPRADRMKAAAMPQALYTSKRIGQWKRAFDRVYGSANDGQAPNFVGWTNSYTNKPLPEAEMREWLDATLNRIMLLRPDKVLEIGCGVGLLVQALAPKCSVYRGTDLSRVAVERLRDFIAADTRLGHVELFERAAIDFSGEMPGQIDTVIVNSVVQYFPSLDYLRTVIEDAVPLVVPGGTIFIGDVRHLDSLWPFHTAVQLAKASPEAPVGWLKRRIALAVEQERELLIAPAFFRELIHSIPTVSQVKVLPKLGSAVNELTRYRYDVVIHIGEARPFASEMVGECCDEWQFMRAELPETTGHIDGVAGEAAALRDDIVTMHRLWSADDRQSIGEFRAGAETDADPVKGSTVCWPIASERDALHRLRRRRIATSPMEAAYRERLGMELSDVLSERSLGSRGPAAVLVVSELPRDAVRLPSIAIDPLKPGSDCSTEFRHTAVA